jgi:hypothetical protein
MTLSLPATAFLDCYGSLTFPATNFSFSGTGSSASAVRFRATTTGKTITTNGVTINCSVIFDGTGGEWTLGSSLTCTVFNLSRGSFDTGNYNLTATSNFSSSGSNTSSLTLGSSTVAVGGGVLTISGTNLTFNAGTSQINANAASANLTGGGNTFYNVSFTSTSAGTHTITGANTFNDLTFAARAASGIGVVNLSDNQTITGTLTVQSGNTDPTRRIRFSSDTLGTARTITAAAVTLGSGIDFRDITAAGVASPFNVSTLEGGDCGGNTDITFPAAKTVYRIGTGNFSATQWASTSGGSPAADQFPLAQDTMVFDANTTTGTHSVTAKYQLGTLTMTNSTTVTLSSGTGGGTTPTFYGNMTLSNAVTPAGNNEFIFSGRSTQTITSSSRTFTQPITIQSLSTVQLADALVSNLDLTLTQGTLDLDDNTATCRAFSSDNSNTRSIAFGTGKIVCSGNSLNVINMQVLTGFSYTGTSRVELSYSGGSGTRSIRYGGGNTGNESNAINVYVIAGTDTVTLRTDANSTILRTLDFTGFSGTLGNASPQRSVVLYGNLIFSSGMTLAASLWSATGINVQFLATSGIQQITSNGKTLDFPIIVSAPGATVQLQDNLTQGSTRTFTHTAGTVDLDGKTLTAGAWSSSNSNVREIDFGVNGILNCQGAFTATTGTNLTTSGTGRIKMSSASAKTFAGGGRTYPALDQAGAGTLTITGANTFADIVNTNATASQITFPANTITKVQDFTLQGNPGELVSLRSSTSGTRFTIEKV